MKSNLDCWGVEETHAESCERTMFLHFLLDKGYGVVISRGDERFLRFLRGHVPFERRRLYRLSTGLSLEFGYRMSIVKLSRSL